MFYVCEILWLVDELDVVRLKCLLVSLFYYIECLVMCIVSGDVLL